MSTIIVHGNLASHANWWHENQPGGFLDSLARGMQLAGRENDVWTIGGRSVSQFESLRPHGTGSIIPFHQSDGRFSWSGHNMHVMRLHEGVQLARYLEALSDISHHEMINIVAHGHGGNLVKIATNHVAPRVRLGRIVFLAVPHCENVAGGSGKYLYPLNAPLVCADAGGPHAVLNVYSEEDLVQTKLADAGLDFITAPGTPMAPVFTAHRVDPDPAAQTAYDNLKLQSHLGHRAVHSLLHGPTVATLVGFWLANWPKYTGEDCRKHFGIEVLTENAPVFAAPTTASTADIRPAPAAGSSADIGPEAAKHAALAYLVRTNPAWPGGLVQSIKREGPHFVVTLMPENKMGILLFAVSYKVWVDAATGNVDKLV